MDDTSIDWDTFFDFSAYEPAGTEASGPEGRTIAVPNIPEKLPDADATSNAEPSPTQATLSDSGDQANKVLLPVLDILEGCTCLACAQERPPSPVRVDDSGHYKARCRIPPCTFLGICFVNGILNYTTKIPVPHHLKSHASKPLCYHETAHFGHQGEYKCAEKGCGHLTKTIRDLKRHYRAKHCTKTPGYPCNVLGCNFGGENGFHRKDKLASHYKNMHQGRVASVAHHRNIIPAPAKNEVPEPGIGQSSQ